MRERKQDEGQALVAAYVDIEERDQLFTLAREEDRSVSAVVRRADGGAELHASDELDVLDGGRRETVSRGLFGARMQVSLVNDGPVTIVLDT